MVLSLNKVTLAGNVGKVTQRETKAGIVANLSVATSKSSKNAEGIYEKKTTWHNLVLFGKLAELVVKFDGQMKEVYVEGELIDASYEKDGKKVHKMEIIANQLQIISFKDAASGANTLEVPPPTKGKRATKVKDDDIDF